MSVMLLSNPKGYARIINTYLNFKEQLQGHVWETFYSDELEPIVYGLYLANAKSYSERYDEEVKTFDFDIFKKEVRSNPSADQYPNIYQFLKSLHCLRYNIEINIKKEDNISIINGIKFLDDLIRGLTEIIIRSHSEYEQAKYGI